MELFTGLAVVFLGFTTSVAIWHTVVSIPRWLWSLSSGWFMQHIILPQLVQSRVLWNPTRLQLLYHCLHLALALLYNIYGVRTVLQGATRAAQLSLIHIIPLIASYQLGFVSDLLGCSLHNTITIHTSLGMMAATQAALHSVLYLTGNGANNEFSIIEKLGLASVLALSILPLARHFAYEIFLHLHRATTVLLAIVLWEHIKTRRALIPQLLKGTLVVFLSLSVAQILTQIYRNINWGRHGPQIAFASKISAKDEPFIVKVTLSRYCKIEPGQYVYLCLLRWEWASIVQRHPFTVTWWESDRADSKTNLLYLMISPQGGWTQSVVRHNTLDLQRHAWIDGPFGSNYRLGEYGTVVLFASSNGVFAQIPLLKGLVEGLKCSDIKTRKIKLVWQTEYYHDNQLRTWIQSILNDRDIPKEFLEIFVHLAPAGQHGIQNRSQMVSLGQRVKVVYHPPNAAEYVRRDSIESMAVTVSGSLEMRLNVRKAVIETTGNRIRLFELDYQPGDEPQTSNAPIASQRSDGDP